MKRVNAPVCANSNSLAQGARRQRMIGLAIAAAMCVCAVAQAHGVNVGGLYLEHPYAVPSAPGEVSGKAYLRAIKNSGDQSDRLLGATASVATSVELNRIGAGAQKIEFIPLPANSTTLVRHTGDYQLSLINLKRPLKDGQTFEMSLQFEKAGVQTVRVSVQTPRDAHAGHTHD